MAPYGACVVDAILIAGPTASGKSALALELARQHGGAIINADSQQVFRDWRVLTARPSVEDEAAAPHYLYGHLPLDAEYSVGHWLRELVPVLEACRTRGEMPIITGGTGLFFKALTEGLAPIPLTPPETRLRGEALLEELGLAAFAADLARRDPRSAAATDMENPMRVLRAWEVLETTGKGIADWRAETPPPLLPLDRCDARLVLPEREALYARCDARFDKMIAGGALEEATRVREMALPPSAPGLKALGAAELLAYLDGELALEEAAERAKTATRRYAKRQLTWGRNQMSRWKTVTI
ncbi:tRNA (adenosine(37)-N6)-dimethylallyltransferase MiaA [Rhodobacteraceae bacterium NNCM2]|nr:tRNA (adenosine(37)-N6)-dimethylallyltransferase MiaA [Coraliihabitans acroporae]